MNERPKGSGNAWLLHWGVSCEQPGRFDIGMTKAAESIRVRPGIYKPQNRNFTRNFGFEIFGFIENFGFETESFGKNRNFRF
jgi:hypothetical protein